MEEKQDIGLLMPKILYPDGSMQYVCKLLPTPFDWIGRRFLPNFLIKKRNDVFELRFCNLDKVIEAPYLSGSFMFLRTEIIKDIGLFDEKIFMYGEDTDLTRRIFLKYKTVYYPDSVVYHEFNKESSKKMWQFWIHIKAAIYYFNKWGWFRDKERRLINRITLEKLNFKK